MKLGIVQGRLSDPIDNKIQAFPVDNWADEFLRAKDMGLSCIEWIFEHNGYKENPIMSENGIISMLNLCLLNQITINSLLADYFMDVKLFGDDKGEIQQAQAMLDYIILQSRKCKIPIVELPFVDQSSLKTEKDKQDVIRNMKESVELAHINNIILSLETDLPPDEFVEFIERFNSSNVRINFDMGNSASLGYMPDEEIKKLGKYICNVHIKDRVKSGGTVPLGTGDTNFKKVFESLKEAEYKGDFILQAARQDIAERTNKEIKETIQEYIEFVKPYIKDFE